MRFEADTAAIAAMIGVAPHTIRNWAARGHLQPVRTEGTRTIYDTEAALRTATALGHLPGPPVPPGHPPGEPCCAPGCTHAALGWTDLPLPVCRKHATAIWLRVTSEINDRLRSGQPHPASPAQPVVYFIRSGDLIKIGTTTCLPARVDALATHGPAKPRILLVAAGGRAEERQVHALFREDRVRGEWFRPSQRLMAFITDRADQDIRDVHGRLVAS